MFEVVFVLSVWMEAQPSPAGVYLDQDECWREAVSLAEWVEAADCRPFHAFTPVGPGFTYAPLTSPRPKPRPEVK